MGRRRDHTGMVQWLLLSLLLWWRVLGARGYDIVNEGTDFAAAAEQQSEKERGLSGLLGMHNIMPIRSYKSYGKSGQDGPMVDQANGPPELPPLQSNLLPPQLLSELRAKYMNQQMQQMQQLQPPPPGPPQQQQGPWNSRPYLPPPQPPQFGQPMPMPMGPPPFRGGPPPMGFPPMGFPSMGPFNPPMLGPASVMGPGLPQISTQYLSTLAQLQEEERQRTSTESSSFFSFLNPFG